MSGDRTEALRYGNEDGSSVPVPFGAGPHIRARLRRAAINLLIVLVIWVQLKRNFEGSYLFELERTDSMASTGAVGTAAASLARGAAYVSWLADYSAWVVGLGSIWRMFAPPHHQRWGYEVYAALSDGEVRRIPLPDDGDRSFLQRNFTDFRETKWRLNIYSSEEGQRFFAMSVCHELRMAARTPEKYPQSIIIVLIQQPILSPPHAERTGSFYGPEQRSELARVECGK